MEFKKRRENEMRGNKEMIERRERMIGRKM